MNPPNPFGRLQGGAFQAPSNTMKTGLFGQQSSNNQPQTMEVFQPSAFGQPSGMIRPSSHGNTVFGQVPVFGQPPAQPAPAFGQPSVGTGSSGFGGGTAPAFGQTSGLNKTSVFGQPSAFGQAAGCSQQAPGFGQTQMTSGSTTTLGQSQPLGFGQSTFGQPASTSVTSVFGRGNSVMQNKPLGPSKFLSFKPATEALFKPIFSASPESTNPQTTSMSSSLFGSSGNQTTSSSTTTGFSLLTNSNSGPMGFSFSLPAAAPSISTQKNPPTTSNSGGPSKNLQFTFSQPAPPSSSSTTKASTTQPTTPSSFSFSIKAPQTQSTPLFEGTGFGHGSAFGDNKGQTESITDEKQSSIEALQDTNVFARLGKGIKRKDDPVVPSSSQEKPATVEDVLAEAEPPRHPPKRPLMRSHGPSGGLFGRALSSLRKEGTNLGRREATKEPQQQAPKWEETEQGDVQRQDDSVAATPPTAQTLTKDVLEKADKSGKATNPELKSFTPVKRGVRRESTESLGSMSSIDCTVLHCRNIPQKLNRKNIIEKHFARFGKVSKVICRPAKNIAFIYFDDHASAAQAKKKGKVLHQHELILLWQRKKQSPGEKESRSLVGNEEELGESPEDRGHMAASSSFRRTQLRAAEGSSTMTFRSSSPAKKITSAKSLQFSNEPQKESGTESQSSEHPVPSSLLHLIGQVAETSEDKYRLLEQRDKELRQGRPKRTDLNLSKAFVGTCPDMCPEKERYMRETRNQLSIFEVIPNTEMVDHTAAIKEYSRSSADKEEPLPNELRPLPVLSMTMDYLVTQIMDQGHDNYRDWYDFVWNRTRGIRKDITQQHLCCPKTVLLIEKCTRFHVHCAHHLCEQHMSSFDPKINNENMTKCLQSLKEMYQDLALRQIYCSQEAEFRQYSVLLRLNDGDILREVQQFRDEVRNSSEVKFAVQAFAAVNSNNFVRFFKLVKGASYLTSCLLHRYFNQVRAKALQILNIAHTVGPRSTAFQIEDITRMLMFHSTAEAADFIQQYGLNVNEGMVELSRTSYQEPELPLSQKKSEVILAKKTMLIGEVVNGGPLPNPPQHVPICSFDSQNKYRGEVTLAEPTTSQFKALTARLEVKASESLPQVTSLLGTQSDFGFPPAVTDESAESHYSSSHTADALQFFQPIPQPQPVKSFSPPPLPPPPVYSDEEIRAELDGVIEEVIGAALREVADVAASYAKTALVESSVQVDSMVGEVLRQMLQEVSSTEIKLEQKRVEEEKRKREEARRRQEHEAFLNQFSVSLCTELIHEVIDETIKETSKSEIQQAVNEKAERVAKCTDQVCTSLVEETLNADIALIAEEILDLELQRIHKYIKMWRDVVAVRRQLKRQMRGFPAAPCCVDPRFKLKALAPSAPVQPSIADLVHGVVNLGNAGTLALSSTRLLKMRQEAIHQMRVHYFHQLLLDEMVWAPLNLPALVAENIPDRPVRIFWKLALLLPSNHESEASLADGILSDWLEVKLGGERSEVRKEQPDGTLQTLCTTNTLQEKGQHTHIVHVSVKACRGPLTEDSLSKIEEIGELSGTGALIMLLPTMSFMEPGCDEQDVPLLSALLQLKQLQQASSWHYPLPLVILVPGPDGGADDEQKLGEALMLHTLVQEGLISEFMFFFIPETTSDIQGSKQLSSAMCWLLARAPPSFPLSCSSLVELVEASLSREFNSRVHSHHQERATAHLPPQDPAPIIQLYNAVLVHIANTVSSKDLCKISWLPGEFSLPENRHFVPHLGFNSPQHLAWLRKAVLSLQLPQWEKLSSTESWSELCSSIYHYAAQIPVSHHSQPLLMSRLENLLEKVRLKCHRAKAPKSSVTMGSWDSGNGGVFPAYSQIPWEDVLVICIDHKLKDWQIPGPPVCKDAVTEDGEILVYFPTEALNSFQPPEEWTQAIRQTHRDKQQEEKGASAAACITPSSLSLRQRLFHNLVETPESLAVPLDITHSPTAQELLAHKLLQSVEEEKAESKRSMEQLQRWLDGDPSDQLSTPLFLPSSTLLSMPTTIIRTPTLKSRHGSLAQESDHLTKKAEWPIKVPASFEWRLKELEREILASQEEELACRLELSSLLNIVDD